jgi:signal transduction histidine kinase
LVNNQCPYLVKLRPLRSREAPVLDKFFRLLDWFIPGSFKHDRSDLGVARVFVFTHLFGPALGQSMSVFLYRTDPAPGPACWIVIASICSFWLLPFVLKVTRSLQLVAFISVEILAFASLFGAYFYGGVSSPFLPWLVIALFLGCFYLSDRPRTLAVIFFVNLAAFAIAYVLYGFPERVPLDQLSTLGWVSIASATIYMSWMAVYYNILISMRSELERETERHRATAVQLQRAKELAEKANHERSIFLAKMSHELRTPLNAVIGYSEILLEDELERGSKAKIADLQRVNEAGKHLLSLVTDVLDLTKIESEAMELNVEPFELKELTEQVIAAVRPMAEEKRNEVILNCIGTLGIVRTDATKLRQILLNLLSNAAKFTSGGTIEVTAFRTQSRAADWIEIRVKDSGIGIDRADIPKLFQEFHQATRATSTKFGGTGLGLAVSQGLCRLLGGAISCQSELGRGSCFIVRVPAELHVDPLHDSVIAFDLRQAEALAVAAE